MYVSLPVSLCLVLCILYLLCLRVPVSGCRCLPGCLSVCVSLLSLSCLAFCVCLFFGCLSVFLPLILCPGLPECLSPCVHMFCLCHPASASVSLSGSLYLRLGLNLCPLSVFVCVSFYLSLSRSASLPGGVCVSVSCFRSLSLSLCLACPASLFVPLSLLCIPGGLCIALSVSVCVSVCLPAYLSA